MLQIFGGKPVRRFAVAALFVVAVATLCVSTQRLYGSQNGCVDLVCESNDGCKKNQCDFCAGDKRCALIPPDIE